MKNITPKSVEGLLTETPLIVSTGETNCALAPEAPAIKVQLLKISSAVTEVNAPEHVAPAVHAVVELKRIAKLVEQARVLAKEKYLQGGREVDAKAKNYLAEINAEILRIEGGKTETGARAKGLLGAWNEREAARIQAEQKRIDDEAAAAQKVLADALAAQEKLAAKPNATTRQEVAADTRVQEAMDKVTEAASQVAAPTVTAAGMKPKMVVVFNVTDAAALYAVRPEWFDLVPKRIVMKAAITKTTKLPGLEVKEELETKIRA